MNFPPVVIAIVVRLPSIVPPGSGIVIVAPAVAMRFGVLALRGIVAIIVRAIGGLRLVGIIAMRRGGRAAVHADDLAERRA